MIDKAFRFQGQVFRGHNPAWSYAPESGDGAARHGGRFNSFKMPALYTSIDFRTAWAEAQQAFPFKSQPLTLCAYEVDCRHVLDLTDPKILVDSGFSMDDLSCNWELLLDDRKVPPSWDLAKKLSDKGVSAIKVPSFAPGAPTDGINIIFWKWDKIKPYKVVVIDDNNRLPKNKVSWE